ncbi:MAG TPA: hypothetical protein VNI56_00420 [Xanthomonadaceae bacterium]|nr:hypothetical protein [Xanthomonadaceae bacterium]
MRLAAETTTSLNAGVRLLSLRTIRFDRRDPRGVFFIRTPPLSGVEALHARTGEQ